MAVPRTVLQGGVIAPESLFLLLVLGVLGVPPLVATVGAVLNRDHSFQYLLTAAVAILTAFLLTGASQFGHPWAALAIGGVLLAIARHLWAVREHRTDFAVVAGIYLMPVGLSVALLARAFA